MESAKKRIPSGGPTRRKVLATALAAGASVATARVLGLRNLGGGAATEPLDAMSATTGMDAMGTYAMSMDDVDGAIALPDDAFFGPQDLDGSVLPEVRPAAPLPQVSASRSVTGTLQPPISGINAPRLADGLDWISPLSSDAARVAHLLRRATFGYTEAELDRALSEGFARTVDRLIETPTAEPPPFAVRPAATPTPRPSASASARPSASATTSASAQSSASASPRPSASPAMSPSAARTAMPNVSPLTAASPSAMPSGSTMPSATPAPMTNTTSINIGNLQTWWIDWMTQSPTPFAEKMTLFWHGHFTSDYRKVGTNSPAMYWQNQTWRKMAMGDLRTMVYLATQDMAMLRYLDLAVSTGRAPNENYARELMELFTLGVGNYTEDDVKAAAKALSGWRLPTRQEPTVMQGIFDTRRAFTGPVTFLGKTATFDTSGIVDQLLAQDAVAPFVTRELARFFVSPGVTDAYVARLADGFRRSKYETKSLMRAMFMSPEFSSPEAYRSLIKSPTEFMISTAKALGATNLSQTIRGYGSVLGQNLFDPPSVAGWGDGASWISSNTMLQRANYVSQVLSSLRQVPSAAKAHERHLDSVLGAGTVQELNNARDDRSRWFAVFVSPEFQLK
jgi:uncharacterized protein (DUF1800 family)